MIAILQTQENLTKILITRSALILIVIAYNHGLNFKKSARALLYRLNNKWSIIDRKKLWNIGDQHVG